MKLLLVRRMPMVLGVLCGVFVSFQAPAAFAAGEVVLDVVPRQMTGWKNNFYLHLRDQIPEHLKEYVHPPQPLMEQSCEALGAEFALNSGMNSSTKNVSVWCNFPLADGGVLRRPVGVILRQEICPLGYNKDTVDGQPVCTLSDVDPARNLGSPECCNGTNPINSANGNKHQRETDYRANGVFPLEFTRYYNSNASPNTQEYQLRWPRTDAEMGDPGRGDPNVRVLVQTRSSIEIPERTSVGVSWRHNYDRRLKFMDATGAFHYGADGKVTGLANRNGVWVADSGQDLQLEPELGPQGEVQAWVLTDRNDLREVFDPEGRLLRIVHRSGLAHTLEYANGLLSSVTDDFGNRLEFDTENGRIVGMRDPGGNPYLYEYDAADNPVAVVYPDESARRYAYTSIYSRSYLSSIADNAGNVHSSWTYDNAGRATSSQRGTGSNKVQIQFVSQARAVITDDLGRNQAIDYENVGGALLPKKVTGPRCDYCGGQDSAIGYDNNGHVISRTDFAGTITRYTRDSRGLELSRTEAYGTPQQHTTTMDWHPDFNLPLQVTEPGRTSAYTYDANGNRLTETVTDTTTGPHESNPRTATWAYNTFGQVLTVDGPRTDVNDITTYTYDASGNLATATNALGHLTQYPSYDAHGNPLRIVDPNGVVTELEYDVRQRLISRTVAAGTTAAATTGFEYDPVGQLVKTTLPNNAWIAYEYDAAHRMTAIKDNIGNRIDYVLDAMGNRIEERVGGADGIAFRETFRDYNALNRLVAETGPEGSRVDYAYDADGNRTNITDAHGNTTTQRYDALDRLFESVDALSGITAYGYDSRDNLAKVIDPRGVTTDYVYNGFNELGETRSPDAGTTTYLYDKAGNRIAQTDARGVTVNYQYDALNRLTFIDYPEPADGSPSKDISYLYDTGSNALGRLVRIEDETGRTEYAYDARGNLAHKLGVVNTETGEQYLSIGYSFDVADNLASMTYPSGNLVEYVRDTAGRITQLLLTQADGTRTTLVDQVAYAPFGPITQLTFGNGIEETRSFDREGRISRIRSAVLDYGYSWDATGNITAIADNLDATRSQSFIYDPLYRLTEATGIYGNLNWQYDAVGNRIRQAESGVDTVYGYAIDSNRLASVSGPDGSVNYQYDANGNTLDDGDHAFEYDARNRFTEADGLYTYQHNALGQRVSKPRFQTVAPGDASGDGVIDENDLHALRDIIKGNTPQSAGADCNGDGGVDNKDVSCIANQVGDTKNNGKKNQSDVGASSGATISASTSEGPGTIVGTLLFAYDEAGHLIGEYDELGNRIREYVWLGDRPVAMIQDGGVSYVHADHLNTPKVVTDGNQQIVWKGDYKPFGEVDETVDTVEMNLRFPGQYEDAETGLNYNYFRTYAAATGRYTQSDPIGLRGGANTFNYVQANPVIKFDPFGLLEWTGSFRIKGAGFGKIGGQKATFELISECDMEGNKAKITVGGVTSSIGLGPLIGSDVEGKVEFTDGRINVSPSVFVGGFTIDSIGAQVLGFGFGKTNIYIGQAVSTDVSDTWGLDIGVQIGMKGRSHIESYQLISCGCN